MSKEEDKNKQKTVRELNEIILPNSNVLTRSYTHKRQHNTKTPKRIKSSSNKEYLRFFLDNKNQIIKNRNQKTEYCHSLKIFYDIFKQNARASHCKWPRGSFFVLTLLCMYEGTNKKSKQNRKEKSTHRFYHCKTSHTHYKARNKSAR